MTRASIFILLNIYSLTLFAQSYLPSSTTNQLISHSFYTLSYSETHEQPEWVYYELSAAEVINVRARRSDNFREDSKVLTESAALADYRNSGYDRGHLAPAGDMAFSSRAMNESFYMSNMSPQHPSFNRGIWKKLEELTRSWAVEKSILYIATGPVLENGLSTIGTNGVSIPRYYYKAIMDYDESICKFTTIAFLLPNQKSQMSLDSFTISIDSLEGITGMDFYPQLPDSIENIIEANFDLSQWHWEANSINKNLSINQKRITLVQCKGINQNGDRCENHIRNDGDWCYLHESQSGEIDENKSSTKKSILVRCIEHTNTGARCKLKTLSSKVKCRKHRGN